MACCARLLMIVRGLGLWTLGELARMARIGSSRNFGGRDFLPWRRRQPRHRRLDTGHLKPLSGSCFVGPGSIPVRLSQTFQDGFTSQTVRQSQKSPGVITQDEPSINKSPAGEQHITNCCTYSSHKAGCTAMDESSLAVALATCPK